MLKALARALVRHAARRLAPIRPTQSEAIAAELAYIDESRDALHFALGCVAAAYRQRASFLGIGVATARFGTALAAGAWGLVHVLLPWPNVCLKLDLMTGANMSACHGVEIDHASRHAAVWIAGVNHYSMGHWLWGAAVLGLMGALHLIAAAVLLTGPPRRLAWASAPIIVLAIVSPWLGPGGLTFPAIYVGLILLMVATGAGLAWLGRRDLERLKSR